MKIAYEHLLKFLEESPDINDLSSKLLQLGHEHEIENSVLDMEFTPNRGDCLSVYGLARDLNVFYETNLDLPIYRDDLPSLKLNFINEEEHACSQISFLNIEIKGEISEYKDYLNNYFNDLNLNKNNFFTDISNYVAYEIGQPTHSYDFSAIGNDITLKMNSLNKEFTTLLNNKIDLKGLDLVFTSNEEVINLSGIMGGHKTACSQETKNALVECAYFKPETIIGKAVKYNLHSDASHKFERGTDPQFHEKALRRFIQIVDDHCEITKLGLYKYEGPAFKKVELDFNLQKVKDILGFVISEDKYRDALVKLGFDVGETIKVPSFRSDINNQNDLAEELARVIGYDNIPVTGINIGEAINKVESSIEKKIKSFLVDHNFAEVINSPFCSVGKTNSIKVDNPLDSNRQYIRTNLLDSLLQNLIYNEKRQKDSIKLFEISDVYSSEQNLNSKKKLAIIISGRKGENHLDFSKKLDKQYLTQLFQKIDINIDKYFINIDREELDSKIKTPIFAIELLMDDLEEKINDYVPINKPLKNFVKYIPISEFPSSYRDLSFSIKQSSKIKQVISTLAEIKSDIIKNSFMFDFYENKKINESKIGYRFIFQSDIRTLTDIEINEEIKKITNSVLLIESVSLPGS